MSGAVDGMNDEQLVVDPNGYSYFPGTFHRSALTLIRPGTTEASA